MLQTIAPSIESEILVGRGEILAGETRICEARYAIYAEKTVMEQSGAGETDRVMESRRVLGRVTATPEDLSACLCVPARLTLRLQDGRRLDFDLEDSSGRIFDGWGPY